MNVVDVLWSCGRAMNFSSEDIHPCWNIYLAEMSSLWWWNTDLPWRQRLASGHSSSYGIGRIFWFCMIIKHFIFVYVHSRWNCWENLNSFINTTVELWLSNNTVDEISAVLWKNLLNNGCGHYLNTSCWELFHTSVVKISTLIADINSTLIVDVNSTLCVENYSTLLLSKSLHLLLILPLHFMLTFVTFWWRLFHTIAEQLLSFYCWLQ